jgi:hypothetical protein
VGSTEFTRSPDRWAVLQDQAVGCPVGVEVALDSTFLLLVVLSGTGPTLGLTPVAVPGEVPLRFLNQTFGAGLKVHRDQ